MLFTTFYVNPKKRKLSKSWTASVVEVIYVSIYSLMVGLCTRNTWNNKTFTRNISAQICYLALNTMFLCTFAEDIITQNSE